LHIEHLKLRIEDGALRFESSGIEKCWRINVDGFVRSRHPVEKRGPDFYNSLRMLASGFRRNDGKARPLTFYEAIYAEGSISGPSS
jgi:hypothetical protein